MPAGGRDVGIVRYYITGPRRRPAERVFARAFLLDAFLLAASPPQRPATIFLSVMGVRRGLWMERVWTTTRNLELEATADPCVEL